MDRRQRMITGIESMDWNSQASPGSDRSTQAIQRSSNLVEGSMGLLVEWSLSPPEVRGSNPIGVIIENFSTRCYLEKGENEAWNGASFKRRSLR